MIYNGYKLDLSSVWAFHCLFCKPSKKIEPRKSIGFLFVNSGPFAHHDYENYSCPQTQADMSDCVTYVC